MQTVYLRAGMVAVIHGRAYEVTADPVAPLRSLAEESQPVEHAGGNIPPMPYAPWTRTKRTEIGATNGREWYWRCVFRGCRHWAGPYLTDELATDAGMDHAHLGHLPR